MGVGSSPVAAGYARISKDDTLSGRGVDRQSQDIKAVCDRHGWQILDILVDNDISASRFSSKARPGYERLLGLIAGGIIDRAVVYDLDRLLRIPRGLEDLIDLVEKRSDENRPVEIHTVTGIIDLTTSEGRFVARMIVGNAARESDQSSKRLRRALEEKAREGRPHGPRAFGYEADGVTPREVEAELIRAAADDVLAGVSLSAIARRWNDAGVSPPQKAQVWSATAVKVVLINPRQTGMRCYRGTPVKADAWEANLDRLTHERLVNHFARPVTHRPPRYRYPFGGLVTDPHGVPLDRCQVKGRSVYRGHKRPGREAQFVSISADPLERYVLLAIDAAVNSGMLNRSRERRSRSEETLPDLAALERELELLASDWGEGRISHVEWLAAREPLLRRMHEAQTAIDEQAARIYAPVYTGLEGAWGSMCLADQRRALRSVLDSVRIHPAKSGGGPQPMVEGLGRIDVDRVELVWHV